MVSKACDLWLEAAEYRCILTSAAIVGGEAALETRSARDAGTRYAGIAGDLARLIAARGNHVHKLRPDVCSFPIKQHQWSSPTIEIIVRSARELMELVGPAKTLLPYPDEAGELDREALLNALAFLPDNIVLITR